MSVMSPTTASSTGIKGKRVPGKPGRFDPTEPFHMHTRRGTKNSFSNGTSSINGSFDDSDSPRGSLDDQRPATSYSNGTQASAKSGHASTGSPSKKTPPDGAMNRSTLLHDWPGDSLSGNAVSSPSSQEQASPRQPNAFSLKRKRSGSSASANHDQFDTNEHDNFEQTVSSPTREMYDSDTVEVLRNEDLSDREESDSGRFEVFDASPGSSQSQKVAETYNTMGETSADNTPAMSRIHSPATSGSLVDEDGDESMPLAKPLEAALQEVAAAAKNTAPDPEPPGDTVMDEVAPEVEEADEIEEQVRTDDDGPMVVRRGRFGGRRRAQHPDISIEVALRRQAQLKSAYRTMARAQKVMLAEIAQRNIDKLENEPALHTEATEYEAVIQGLDQKLAKRKALIQAQHDIMMQQLKVTLDSEKEVLREKCRRQCDDMQEAKLAELDHESLRFARAAQLGGGDDTEDEDDVVPKLKGVRYHWKRSSALDSAYDSRSRLIIETRLSTINLQTRYNMHGMLKQLADAEATKNGDLFTVFDARPRDAASTNREGQYGLDVLANAGIEVERISKIPVIRNEHALGLQMLGDLASRPSITGGRPQSSGSDQVYPRAVPPSLQLQVPNEPSPIQVQMSPRTQLAMGNRFEPPSMPPPQTPRQEPPALIRSPEAARSERRPSSSGLTGRAGRGASQWSPRTEEAVFQNIRLGMMNRNIPDAVQDAMGQQQRMFDRNNQWRPLEDPMRRRALSHSDPAPPFSLFNHSSRNDALTHREDDKRDQRWPGSEPSTRAKSPKFDSLRSHSLLGPEQPSYSGILRKSINNDIFSPKSEQKSTMADTPDPGKTSMVGNGSSAAKTAGTNGTTSKVHKHPKTNKAERNGAPRRRNKDNKNKLDTAKSEAGGTPSIAASSHAGSPPPGISSIRPPPFFGPPPPPMLSPRGYGPGPFHHGGSPIFPPDHHFHQNPHHRPDYPFHHRNSSGPFWAQTRSPRYEVPMPPRQPPPPGTQDHHWPRPLPPPPPTFPHGPMHMPHPPHSQPGSEQGMRGQFGGPTIAPAAPTFPSGGPRSGQPPPAFEQRQQQSGGSYGQGNRKRAASDQNWPKFQPPWQPKKSG